MDAFSLQILGTLQTPWKWRGHAQSVRQKDERLIEVFRREGVWVLNRQPGPWNSVLSPRYVYGSLLSYQFRDYRLHGGPAWLGESLASSSWGCWSWNVSESWIWRSQANKASRQTLMLRQRVR